VESDSREERQEEKLPFAVCFEVEPTADGLDRYLALAGSLRPELDRFPGFESIERSRSVRSERRLLSLSYWADEASLTAWRSHGSHHGAQVIGRNELFDDYRLRVGHVIRRWTGESTQFAVRPATHNLPENRPKPHNESSLLGLLRLEGLKEADRVAVSFMNRSVEFERYSSMVNHERTFFVMSLADEDAGRAVEAHLMRKVGATQDLSSMQMVFDTCEIQRDYGRFERTQAPQYFPPIPQPTL
jgi:heme-degrading monooxygenase HmoA